MGPLREALVAAVGAAHVLTDPAATTAHERDWTGRFGGRATAVVRPADAAEVAAVVRACAAAGVPVVPQGGNTGLVGGGVPRGGEVVVSLRRLDQIGPVDPVGRRVTCGAGAVLADVDRAAAAHGLAVGVDLAARASATIGGMVATDAGGVHVVAHGSMRRQVRGLRAVMADGGILDRTPALAKDGAGYDLPQLLAGSEGTLAIITDVELRLVRRPDRVTVALVGCDGVAAAQRVLARAGAAAGRGGGALRAAELVSADGMALVAEVTGVPLPVPGPPPWAVLVELEGAASDAAVAAVVGDHPAAVAQDEADVRRLWAVRERHTEAIATRGTAVKLDVAVPPDRLADLVSALDRLVPDAILFGHLAEANLHVNVVDPPDPRAVEAQVLGAVVDLGGTIASEHGVGVAKARWLDRSRDPVDVAAMRAIKRALDPAGLLNPGVLLG